MLNNLDSVRNYGSAADELQVTGLRHHIPDFTEYLQSCASTSAQQPRSSNTLVVPVFSCPPLSVPGSDTESIQKAPWEFEYPNILGNYEGEGAKRQNGSGKMNSYFQTYWQFKYFINSCGSFLILKHSNKKFE